MAKKEKDIKVFVKNKPILLTEKEYKTEGGEGRIYKRRNVCFKIYHDRKKMIPSAKIHELNQINMDNVLGPKDVVFDSRRRPVGFTMFFKDKTEYLKRLFVKSFKDKIGFTIQNTIDLNSKMQSSLFEIHKRKCVVCDHNDLNILVGDNYTTPYYIDVDSWQTSSFRGTAIMELVRDPTVPFGSFNELTDWYSFAIVTFQLYTGLHPFRDGRHPKYGPKELEQRIKDQVSVFDKDVKLPSFCPDFSMIPNVQLDWYKKIFLKGKREEPPIVGKIVAGQVISRIVVSHGDFVVKMLKSYDDSIRNVFYYSGKRYVVTNSSVYCKNKQVFRFKTSIKHHKVELADNYGEEPVIGYLKNDEAKFTTFNREDVGKILAEDMMVYNGIIYTVHDGELFENTFEKFGKIIHKKKKVCNIHESSCKVFKGVVVQNILGNCWMAIPYEKDFCTNRHIEELDGRRIIDATHDKGICIVISEKSKKYYRSIIFFDKEFNSYEFEEEKTNLSSVNFVRLPNGICALPDDNKLLLFLKLGQKKEIGDPPFGPDVSLYHENMQVQFVEREKLYSVTMK